MTQVDEVVLLTQEYQIVIMTLSGSLSGSLTQVDQEDQVVLLTQVDQAIALYRSFGNFFQIKNISEVEN